MNINPTDQIRTAKARYCRFLDTKQWSAFGELLVPAPHIQFFDPSGALMVTFDSRDVFVESARSFLEGAHSIHQVHNDELIWVSANEVSAIWSMEDYVVYPSAKAGQPSAVHGYGHYHETWVLSPEGWQIARLEMRRTILETTLSVGDNS